MVRKIYGLPRGQGAGSDITTSTAQVRVRRRPSVSGRSGYRVCIPDPGLGTEQKGSKKESMAAANYSIGARVDLRRRNVV